MSEASVRVLFVEDDAVLAGIVVRHLQARGHDARSVGSAEETREALGLEFEPDIVLLDINLPGASGWDLLRVGAFAAVGSPPVYLVTATAVPPARLREFDIAGFLPKPFAMTTLVEIVERDWSERTSSPTTSSSIGGLD